MEFIFANAISVTAIQTFTVAWNRMGAIAGLLSRLLCRSLSWLGRLLTHALVAALGRFSFFNY